jgi:hypothetical protein
MKVFAFGVAAMALFLADVSPEAPLGVTMPREAAAIVGAPATPMSVAGVARRTTVRTAEAAAVGAQQQQAAAAQQQQAAAKQQQAAPAQAPMPAVGTVVSTLPSGCVAAPKNGIEYQKCGDVYFRAGFQGNNLVYVVEKP